MLTDAQMPAAPREWKEGTARGYLIAKSNNQKREGKFCDSDC